MRVYHGSDVEVREVDLSRSLMFKDFGPGFYVSAQRRQAENFASYKADRPWSKTKTPVVSLFEMDDACLTDGSLRIKRFEGYSEEWIEFIDEHRASRETEFDLVIGPIANDDVRTSFALYQMGELTKAELLEKLKYKKVTYQYCFKTEAAVARLRRIEE